MRKRFERSRSESPDGRGFMVDGRDCQQLERPVGSREVGRQQPPEASRRRCGEEGIIGRKRFAVSLSLAILWPLSGWAELTVASLSTITTDIAQNVGGDKVKVLPIIKPGVDPHEFQPTPQDIKQISNADLVLITGKQIEGYLTKLEESTGGAGKFVNTGAAFPSLKLEEEGKSVEDPHWWHSIENMKKATTLVKKRFAEADPANKAIYEGNAAAYLEKLAELESWAKREVAKLPREKRKLVTSHDAFQYLARDFGFKIYAIDGISTDDEPSSRKIADLIDTIKREGVKAVFFESIENPKVAEEITRRTGAKVGGELYADGLGDKTASTYPDMVRHNVTTIVEGLK
jgi:zinc/manganese transport system substrate-binding protein